MKKCSIKNLSYIISIRLLLPLLAGVFAFCPGSTSQASETIFLPASTTEIKLHEKYPGASNFTVSSGTSISGTPDGIFGNNSQNWLLTNFGSIQGGVTGNGSGIQLSSLTKNMSIVRNYGAIASQANAGGGPAGIEFDFGGQVFNYSTGVIQGYDGVHTDNGPILVENYGTIRGLVNSGAAIYSGQGALIRNYRGGIISGEHFGIRVNGPDRTTFIYNYGLISSKFDGVRMNNGAEYTVFNDYSGIIQSNRDGISLFGDQAYVLNHGLIQADSYGIYSGTGDTAGRYVNTNSIQAGNTGIYVAGEGNIIYNLATVSGATSAITFSASNNLLVLGTTAYLPRLGYAVQGPGSNLVGDAVVTGAATGNRILLTDTGNEDSALTGFLSLTMQGEDWFLSNPLTLGDGSGPGFLHVQQGYLSLTGDLDSDQVLINNSGTLSLYQGLAAASVNVVNGGTFEYGGDSGNFDAMDITVAAGGLFRLSRQTSRLTFDPADTVNLTLNPGSYFGVTVGPDPASHSIFSPVTFAPAEGALLDINGHTDRAIGISSLPSGGNYYQGVVQAINPVAIPSSMQIINNPLVSASMVVNPSNNTWADLGLTIRDLNAVYGPHIEAADIWRRSSLPTTTQRRWLDALYRFGRLGKEGLAFFRILDGHNVLAAQDAYRANLQRFTGVIDDRLNTLYDFRLGDLQTALRQIQSPQALAKIAPSEKSSAYAAPWQPSYSIWAAASQRWASQDNRSNILGYTYDPHGFTLGVDRTQGNWVLGIAAQYDQGDVEADADGNLSSTVKVKSGIGGVYAAYQTPRWYGQAGLRFGFASNQEEASYRVWDQQSKGSFNSTLLGAGAEFGYNLQFGDSVLPYRITPHIGVDFGSFRQEGFTEKGPAAISRSFASNTYTLLETPLGVRFTKAFVVKNSMLAPYADFTYAHNFGDTRAVGSAAFTALPGDSWAVYAPNSGREAYRLSTGIAARLNNRVDLDLSYTLDLRNSYWDQGARLGVGINF